jgi:hypothetical protein
VANAVQSISSGAFEVGSLINEATQDFGYMAWRADSASQKLVAVTSYVGNASNPRTISLALDGVSPIFALCVPTNGGKRWVRHGSVARQWNGSTSGASNAITAFAADAMTVGSELNANGVTYSVFALAAGVDPPPARRLILLLGYWPPTDKGNMLAAFEERQQYRRLNGQLTNYDVQAMSAAFTQIGTADGLPFYGGGTGDFRVDFRYTSADFWNIVPPLEPIAIMSFSWMPPQDPEMHWRIEQNSRNRANADWQPLTINYLDNSSNPQAYTILAPFRGGFPEDPSPYQNTPKDGNPPDSTQNADHSRTGLPESLADLIVPAVEAVAQVNAEFGAVNAVGSYVSGFMAYHVAWYRENNSDCEFAGHTHVAEGVTATTGEMALRAQLDVLVDALDALP